MEKKGLLYTTLWKTKWSILSTVCPKLATKLMYENTFHTQLDLKNPKNFNEKLQYLKLGLYYNNSLVTQCVDKYRVRLYLEKKGMDKLLPELYGVYKNAKEIDWKKLPDKYVAKCSHGCGMNILCFNHSEVNPVLAEKQLNKWLKTDLWKISVETQYKFLKKKDRRIIIEENLGHALKTYKFYCFNGEPKMLYVSSCGPNGEHDLYLDFFDMDWNKMDIEFEFHKSYPGKLDKPNRFDEMIDIAKNLSAPFPFVRIDLYNTEKQVYLSEFTIIPTGGFMKINPPDFIDEMGTWLVVP